MPLLIDSAPDCLTHSEHYSGKDIADFILNDNFKDCDDGTGAQTLYMIVTWLGIVVMVAVLVAWVLYENRRLIAAAAGFTQAEPPATGPPPQPGGVGDVR